MSSPEIKCVLVCDAPAAAGVRSMHCKCSVTVAFFGLIWGRNSAPVPTGNFLIFSQFFIKKFSIIIKIIKKGKKKRKGDITQERLTRIISNFKNAKKRSIDFF
jgi:hypothetical protein